MNRAATTQVDRGDDNPGHARATGQRASFTRLKVLGGLVAVAAIALLLVTSADTTLAGTQAPRAKVGVSLASRSGWVPFVALDGEARAGFPEPMVSRSSDLCVGFSRVDFGVDHRRPSLARCVSVAAVGSLNQNEIVTLNVVAAGRDTWHFVEAATEVKHVEVELAEDGPLSDDRILVAGSTFALRLSNDTPVKSLEWSTTEGDYRCTSDADSWQSSVFCSAS